MCRCPPNAYDVFLKRFKDRRTGTAFTGSKIGVSVDDLLKAPLIN